MVGAVLPHPHSGRGRLSTVTVIRKADAHEDQPERPVALKDMVIQGQVFGFAAVTGVEKAQDVQDREDEGNDGQLHPDDTFPAMGEQPGAIERPKAVRRDRDRR